MNFAQVLDDIQEGIIIVDQKAKIVVFNQIAAELMDVSVEQSIGRPVEDVVPNTRLPIILKTGREELNRKQKLKRTAIITNRKPLFDERGNIVGAYALFRDITQIKEMSRQLNHLRELIHLLESILYSTEDAISVVDEKGLGVYINPAYTRITGLTEKDVIGKPATVDITEGESIHMKVLKSQKPIKGKLLKVGPNGKRVIVDVAPLFIKGQLKGSVGVIHDTVEIKKLSNELEQAKQMIRNLEAKYTFEDIIGEHSSIKKAIERAKVAAKTPATVLLRGESGTGKELFAHAIHNVSNRKNNPFIRVNCAAFQESLLNSELFGYVEGAFTGAKKGGKKGFFEEANGGTIFLDEIGEISLNTQAKILRVLQEKEIIPVGGNRPIHVDVRIIAATNVDLEEAVEEKKFRKDLYYRLNVFPIYIPELKERKEDIPLLCKHLIRKYNQEYGRSVDNISQEAIKILMKYHWPGNVRELENAIGRAMINMKIGEKIIKPKHLPILEVNLNLLNEDRNSFSIDHQGKTLREFLEEMEKAYIQQLLRKNKGNKTKTAKDLNISIRSLYYKLEKHQLE
ncbi:sigma-54 interaction domain-containing protein [Garciella nitratireducens]|uniref:PAS domain S-box-containing protein n=1 Tax=Garciella nitratireducens DSM 15102 TaxID=1121911 RepID=A0A1T4MUX1_9FIRM|nr:sigma-54-dependent Fis family transcriptional regulator [Garciella nitratireducens]SJZ70773.1 PAS domain S-box-containing protein [Garciella nitratireducens DSM 15102]